MTRPVSCFFPPSGGKCVFPLLLLQAEINITTSRLCAYPARKKITHKILGDTLKLNEQKGEEWTLSSGDLSCVVLWAACRDEGNGALQQKKKETDSGYVLHSTETRTTHGKERKRADECNRRHPTEGRGKFFSIQNIPLIYFFFLGVAGYCWTRQPKKKKVEGEKIFIGSMRFHSLPACASHGWELSKRTYSSIDIYMQKAWERADVNAPARPLSVPFFARNISWHLCLMALTSKKGEKFQLLVTAKRKKRGRT